MINELEKLIAGYKDFKKKYFEGKNSIYGELVRYGQNPKVMIIACSDSRVDPAMILHCQPGESFVVRNVANLVPPSENSDTYHGTSAALEFGVRFLEVEHIIIFGHTQCGGIQALIENQITKNKSKSFINKWMELAFPAYEKVIKEHAHANIKEKVLLCEQYSLINSLQNLYSFDWIKERIENKQLTVHA